MNTNYKWIPKEWIEKIKEKPELFNEKPKLEYDLFCEFLELKKTEKSKKLLEELKEIKTDQDWKYFQLNSKFESFLKFY